MKRIIPSLASVNQLYIGEELKALPEGTPLHVDI